MDVLNWIVTNLFGEAAILLGIIVLVGLLLQRKSVSEIVQGVIKAVIGFLIINAGAGIVVGALQIFEPMWAEIFGLEPQAFSNFMGQSNFLGEFGSVVALSMTLGFILNVLLARFTKLKFIYLTGHMMFWTSTIMAGIIVHAAPNVSSTQLTIFLSILLGVYWTVQPALTQPLMRRITNDADIALGHTSASVALLGALLGKLFGNKENDAEKIEVSRKWAFVRDSNIVTGLSMALLFTVGAILLYARGTEGAQDLIAASGDTNFIVYAILTSLSFAGGIAVILYGVRMFVGEIVPAFNGIATKIVPGAKPALDCPIVYPYGPNSVIIGFLGTFVGIILWILILGKTTGYVVVPTMIVLFFHGATAGVFGNETGGVRGAFLGGFITATVVALGQYYTVTRLISSTIPDTAMWAADSDMFIMGPFVSWLAKLLF